MDFISLRRVSPVLSSSTIIMCTQHITSMTGVSGSETSYEKPEPQNTTKPEVKKDSRPIYPNRIEMVYNRYLARKRAYLEAYPRVKES